MGNNWDTVRLGDHVDACLGKMLDKNKNQGAFQPYLGNKQVRWGSFDLDNLSEMKFQDHEHERYGLKPGDLVVCEGGEPGRCAIWKSEVPNMKIQKALHRIRSLNGLNITFLHYWFCFAGKYELLDPYFTGTTIKHLTGKALAELPIPLPPLSEQKAIAHILGSLDDKIELNRRMNATLEGMAQALFKSWFSDFDPVIDNILANNLAKYSDQNHPSPNLSQAAHPHPRFSQGEKSLSMPRSPSPSGSGDEGSIYDGIPEEFIARAEIRRKALANGTANREVARLFPAAFHETEEMGWIPEGWDVSTIGEEVDCVGGGTPSTKNAEFWDDGDIHWTTPKDLSNQSSNILLKTDRKITKAGLSKISSGLLPVNTVLMSSRAPVGYLALAKVPVAINQGYIAMRCTSTLTPEYVIQWANSIMDDIQQRASGTTFAEISKKSFRGITVIVPDNDVLKTYSKTVSEFYNKVTKNLQESCQLERLRDTLIPRLISGELRIEVAEKVMEVAT